MNPNQPGNQPTPPPAPAQPPNPPKRGLLDRLLNTNPPQTPQLPAQPSVVQSAQPPAAQMPQATVQQPAAVQATIPPPPEPERLLASWNAPEFTYTQKPAGWYVLLALFFVILIVIAVLTRQWLSIAVFAVMGVAVAVMASRKPRMLNYSITNHGIQVGEKTFAYNQFTAFFEADDYGQAVYELVPIKRFAPLVSLPAPPEQGQTIETTLSQILPRTQPRHSLVEQIFKTLRF